jgi:hypoxanthine phosphoribosyltransferase
MKAGERLTIGPAEIRVLHSEEEIRRRVREMAADLAGRLGRDCPIFIALLHGGFVFLSDLVRAYGAPHEIDFLKVSRYDPKQKDPTAVRVMHDLRSNIHDRNVIVVEGIRARGTKIEYVDRFLQLHHPRRVEYCAMVQPEEANLEVPIHQTGFRIGREFVVGYGLDHHELHRNLSMIGVLEKYDGQTILAG